jgi:8-oxo-dGTP pyrophosphatase MutT (NUDIX family)
VHTVLAFQHNVSAIPDVAVDLQLDAVWQARVKANPMIYNGTKFRLAGVHDTTNSVVAANTLTGASDVRLVLDIGICDYRTYVTRNQSSPDNLERLHALGLAQYGDSRALLADPLGVGVFLATEEEDIVLIERSKHTGELAGWYDLPGGHPEPKNVDFKHSVDDLTTMPVDGREELEKVWQSPTNSQRLSCEVFGSVVDEVAAEINLTHDDLSASPPELLSIMRQSQSGGRPCALFRMRTSLQSEQVCARYVIGGEESTESSCMVLVPRSVLANRAGDCRRVDPCGKVTNVSFSTLAAKLTPSAWAAFSKLVWSASE